MFNSDHKDKQVELFSDLSHMTKKSKKAKFNLGKIALSLSYENIILLSIGLIMLLIVCYSLGVERGKYLVQLKSEDIEEVEQKQAQKTPKVLPPKPQEKRIKIKVAQALESPKTPPYIQVASFRTDKYAKEELERLKNKGHHPFLTRWGNFRVVCVGGYKNKNEAVAALKQLRKVYADCILRR